MIDIREIIPVEEVIEQVMKTVTALIAQPYKVGETVCTRNGLVGRIEGKNEDGIYYLFVPFLQCM
jgi:hypothetical protein